MKKTVCILFAAAGLIFSSTANADMFFSQNFDTAAGIGDIAPLVQTGGSGTLDFTGPNVVFSGAGNDGRAWIGTTDSDYGVNQSFVAEVDVLVEAGTNNEASLYLGLGAGNDANNAGQSPGFDEPSVGPVVYVGVRDNAAQNHILGDFNSTSTGAGIGANTAGSGGVGTHVLRLEFNSVTKLATFSIQTNKTGAFNVLSAIDGSDNGFAAGNSRIFFGASAGRTFDNFTVRGVAAIPEPASLLVLGLGLVGGCSRRRRA